MIGKTVKVFAIIFLLLGLLCTVIGGIYLMDFDVLSGLIVIIVMSILLIFYFSLLYGYGELVDTNVAMSAKMDLLIEQTRKIASQGIQQPAPQPNAHTYQPPKPVYTPPAPVQPPVQPAAPVQPVRPAGWKCTSCGAEYPELTSFCKICGAKRI